MGRNQDRSDPRIGLLGSPHASKISVTVSVMKVRSEAQMTIPSGAAIIACLLAASFAAAQANSPQKKSVNQNSLVIQDFEKKLDDYAKLRKQAQSGLPDPKNNSSAENIKQYQESLAQNIRSQRAQAKAGDIFTPPISQLFKELIATPMRDDTRGRIQASLRNAEPVRGLSLEVNQEYPQTSAMQSTPPTLLANLPKLPPELEYRIVGRELVLLDTKANLIIDLLPDALPGPKGER
jgi:hypothetical protein